MDLPDELRDAPRTVFTPPGTATAEGGDLSTFVGEATAASARGNTVAPTVVGTA